MFQCGCFSVNRKPIEFLTPRSPTTQRKYFFIFQIYDREFPVYRSFYRVLAWTRTVLRKEVGSFLIKHIIYTVESVKDKIVKKTKRRFMLGNENYRGIVLTHPKLVIKILEIQYIVHTIDKMFHS